MYRACLEAAKSVQCFGGNKKCASIKDPGHISGPSPRQSVVVMKSWHNRHNEGVWTVGDRRVAGGNVILCQVLCDWGQITCSGQPSLCGTLQAKNDDTNYAKDGALVGGPGRRAGSHTRWSAPPHTGCTCGVGRSWSGPGGGSHHNMAWGGDMRHHRMGTTSCSCFVCLPSPLRTSAQSGSKALSTCTANNR